MGHSNNLGNAKVKVTFETRKLENPSPNIGQTKLSNFFIIIFFFLRGKGGAATP